MRRDRGQHILEYALLIAAVATALVTMQTYVRRGVQARMRNLSDEGPSLGQYEPYYLSAPGGPSSGNFTTGEGRTSVATQGHYVIRPDRVTGSAVTNTTPEALNSGANSYQYDWPPLP